MKNEDIEKLSDRIKELEKKKMEYLEVDMNASANKVNREINKLQEKIELYKLKEIQKELQIYKKYVRQYPEIEKLIKKEIDETI